MNGCIDGCTNVCTGEWVARCMHGRTRRIPADGAHLLERGSPEALVLVRLQDPHLDEGHHGRLLDARVGLLAAVGHHLGQQHALLHERVLLLQLADLVGAGGQEGHQDALRRRALGKAGGGGSGEAPKVIVFRGSGVHFVF